MADPLSTLIAERAELPLASLHVAYDDTPAAELLADPGVLAVVTFDAQGASSPDPRRIAVALPILSGPRCQEVWRAGPAVISGSADGLGWSSDGDWCQFSLIVDEAGYADIAEASCAAYGQLADFLRSQPHLQVVRLWNYFDAITAGDGDHERYRQFCVGRDAGLGGLFAKGFPAATAIGIQGHRRRLHIYGLASRQGGMAIENPRQLSAWRYPRDYGPVAPGFARAVQASTGPLFISGTAAIVGHRSQFDGDLARQTDEMLANLHSLLSAAGASAAARQGQGLLLKAYLRGVDDVDYVSDRLRQALPALSGLLVLAGDVCRRELVVEIDGVLLA